MVLVCLRDCEEDIARLTVHSNELAADCEGQEIRPGVEGYELRE
jgi:hypothetical protein